jgi:hypothetical protein
MHGNDLPFVDGQAKHTGGSPKIIFRHIRNILKHVHAFIHLVQRMGVL